VIALVSPGRITIRKTPDAVNVLDANYLRRWLLKRPIVLAETDLVELAAIVDAPPTWATPALPLTPNLMTKFAGLDVDVRTARTRRTVWKLLSIGTATVLGVLVGLPLLSRAVEGLIMNL
jgi:hypothetical protein